MIKSNQSYTYIVTRHGSNAANQSMTPEMDVGSVEAANRREACRLMADEVTVYNNQFLSAKLLSRATRSEIDQLNASHGF